MRLIETAMESKKSLKEAKKKNLLLVQDVNYAKNLAANDEKVRRRALKYLKKYLQQRSEGNNLTEENLKVLWKGLFFSMWMSDKPLIQEECAENISHLIYSMSFQHSMDFFRVGLITLQNEWFGIDQHRINKFMMFVRRFLRQALFVLKKVNFKKRHNKTFAEILENTILSTSETPPLGLFMHFTEIYLEELAKVSGDKLQSSRTLDLLKPYIAKLAFTDDRRVTEWIDKFIFTHLMKQHKLGLEYEDKYNVWKANRFEGSINQIQKVVLPDDEDDDDESEEVPTISNENKPLDPRAGRVDVELPQIKFNSKDISETFLEFKTDSRTSKHTRHFLKLWADRFEKLHKGIYPLGIKRLEKNKQKKDVDMNVTKAAKKLIKFEQKLLARDRRENKRKRDNKNNEDEPITKKRKVAQESKKTEKKSKRKDVGSLENEINKVEKKEFAKLKQKLKKSTENKLSAKKDLRKAKKKEENGILKDIPDFDYCFQRNSGMWFVSSQDTQNCTLSSTSKPKRKNNQRKSQNNEELQDQPTINNENDDNAEYGIFIPSKKSIKKLKKTKAENEINEIVTKLRGKNKKNVSVSKSPKNPRKSPSPKKVKINTKLNVSQEIDDHIQQVISSPQIPFDSMKKPGKPLLKTPIKSSPINPFYRMKIF